MKRTVSVILVCVLALSIFSITAFTLTTEKLNKNKAILQVGDTLKLRVKNSTGNVDWVSQNKKVAIVNKNGKVVAKSVGKANILAKVNGKQLKCKITVNKKTYETSNVTREEFVEGVLSTMTLEEKVGQMFYVRCPDSDQVNTVYKYKLGGYILFGKDFKDKTKNQIKSNITSYHNTSEIPLLIGVDEEGGTVVRVSSNPNLRSSPFLSPRDTYSNGGWRAIEKDAQDKADLLLSLGINVNMAPVADMAKKDSFMGDRAFSNSVKSTKKFIKKYVSISDENQIGTVLKHFPGYGNNVDTHTDIVYDTRAYSTFENRDFKPFITGINNGADCILVSHNIVNCMDPSKPASLSKKVNKIIRDNLNFDGVVMTDDLSMAAIEKFTGKDTAAVAAVKAGNDLLCCTDVATQYPAVLKAVKNGSISTSRIDNSVRRILCWKYDLGLFE